MLCSREYYWATCVSTGFVTFAFLSLVMPFKLILLLTLIGRSLPYFRIPCQFFFSFFLFLDFRNTAFAGLSPGDSIWIGLSAGFGESCLSLGFREASWSAKRAGYNQVEPTR